MNAVSASDLNFSIAMPVGAWHSLLPEALASLTTHEIPVETAFLDASGDPRVARAADASGLSFAYRRAGPDAGQSAAIAEGWRETGGGILGWLNADDLLVDGALDLAAAAFAADPELDVFYGDTVIIDAQGRDLGRHGQVADIGPLLRRSNIISQPSCFARRRTVEAIGGIDETLRFTMDWDLWVRLYEAGAKFQRTQAVLSRVYWGPETKTASLSVDRLGEMVRIVRRHAGPWSAAKTVMAAIGHGLLEHPRRRSVQ
ncbi:hypothetical protein FKB34_05820 [Glycocaulis profundi]|nr:hypothetical protein FKB34_05820 [Glycocaulis profundi]